MDFYQQAENAYLTEPENREPKLRCAYCGQETNKAWLLTLDGAEELYCGACIDEILDDAFSQEPLRDKCIYFGVEVVP